MTPPSRPAVQEGRNTAFRRPRAAGRRRWWWRARDRQPVCSKTYAIAPSMLDLAVAVDGAVVSRSRRTAPTSRAGLCSAAARWTGPQTARNAGVGWSVEAIVLPASGSFWSTTMIDPGTALQACDGVMPFLNVCINVCVFPPHGLAVRPRAREWPVDRRWHVGIHQLRRPCVNPYAAWFQMPPYWWWRRVPRPTESSQLSRADGGCCPHHAALQESFCTSLLGTVPCWPINLN
jgi:hypothetical protein